MDVPSVEPRIDTQTDQFPLLQEVMESHTDREHIIDIAGNNDDSPSSYREDHSPRAGLPQEEGRLSSGTDSPTYHASSSNRLNSRNSSFMRASDGYGLGRRSPMNPGLWISVELVFTVGQIIASIVVLSLSRNEHPQAPLFGWIVGYASGCVAMVPILYWRYHNHNQTHEQNSPHLHQSSSQINPPELMSYEAVSDSQASDEENNHTSEIATRNNGTTGSLSTRFNGSVDHFKMALDCFFAVWFVVGNVWIFGGHSSPSDAPKLYRLCIIFLTFSCIGYAMPFILCVTICCCLPCIISVLGFREDSSQNIGATVESINALPIYKFKLQRSGNVDDQEIDHEIGEGGILAEGTEKERAISGEDAVCCICLAKYEDDDELRELPCFHVFHVECVDKWLKINSSCPLCKSDVSGTLLASRASNPIE